jgi:flagellar basal-body rod protein FlgB
MAGRTDIIGYLEAGLKAAGLRGKVIGNNIANLDTPGFRRSEVRFEDLLAKAMDGGAVDLADVAPKVYQPRNTAVAGGDNDVDLDKEVGEMIENGARSRVFLRAMAKLYSQMELAIRDKS